MRVVRLAVLAACFVLAALAARVEPAYACSCAPLDPRSALPRPTARSSGRTSSAASGEAAAPTTSSASSGRSRERSAARRRRERGQRRRLWPRGRGRPADRPRPRPRRRNVDVEPLLADRAERAARGGPAAPAAERVGPGGAARRRPVRQCAHDRARRARTDARLRARPRRDDSARGVSGLAAGGRVLGGPADFLLAVRTCGPTGSCASSATGRAAARSWAQSRAWTAAAGRSRSSSRTRSNGTPRDSASAGAPSGLGERKPQPSGAASRTSRRARRCCGSTSRRARSPVAFASRRSCRRSQSRRRAPLRVSRLRASFASTLLAAYGARAYRRPRAESSRGGGAGSCSCRAGARQRARLRRPAPSRRAHRPLGGGRLRRRRRTRVRRHAGDAVRGAAAERHRQCRPRSTRPADHVLRCSAARKASTSRATSRSAVCQFETETRIAARPSHVVPLSHASPLCWTDRSAACVACRRSRAGTGPG